jgi:hypothetical protein
LANAASNFQRKKFLKESYIRERERKLSFLLKMQIVW